MTRVFRNLIQSLRAYARTNFSDRLMQLFFPYSFSHAFHDYLPIRISYAAKTALLNKQVINRSTLSVISTFPHILVSYASLRIHIHLPFFYSVIISYAIQIFIVIITFLSFASSSIHVPPRINVQNQPSWIYCFLKFLFVNRSADVMWAYISHTGMFDSSAQNRHS
jgi:hypothetical protein